MPDDKRSTLDKAEAVEAARQRRTRPSFMASIIGGNPDFSLISPFPLQDGEDLHESDEFIEKLERFLVNEVDSDEIDRQGKVPAHIWKAMAELGCFGMTVPKEYGGLGLSATNYNRALMEMARYNEVLALTVSAHHFALPFPLLHFGNDEQKEKYLPLVAKGAICAFALTEKEAGSDPSRMQSRADLSQDGAHYILTGEKWYCTNGMIAEYLLFMAKVPPYGAKDIGAFIVPVNSEGLIHKQKREFMGYRGLENATMFFRNVVIPKENMIGPEGRGLRIALSALTYGRVSIAALCLASAKRALSPTLWWANERMQFGSSLGQYEANQAKIADMASDIFALDAVTRLSSSMLERGDDLRIEAAAAKLFASEALYYRILEYAFELRGGRGYETIDSQKINTGEKAIPIERWMRDARIFLIGEGASNTLHLSLVRDLLEDLINAFSDFEKARGFKKIGLGAKLAAYLAKLGVKRVLSGIKITAKCNFSALAPYYSYIDKSSRRLSNALFDSIIKYWKNLGDRQLVTFRIVDIAIDLFTMSVVLSRTDALPDARTIALANYFCNNAKRRIEANFRALQDNSDEQAVEVANMALNGYVDWLGGGTIKQDLF